MVKVVLDTKCDTCSGSGQDLNFDLQSCEKFW